MKESEDKKFFLHIFPADKFFKPYYKLIENKSNIKKHNFIIIHNVNKNSKYDIYFSESKNNVYYEYRFFRLAKIIMNKKYSKIFLHGFFHKKLFLMLYFLPKSLLNKINWIIWGGDLYYYIQNKDNPKIKIYDFFRKKAIKKFGGIITYIKGDYELAKKYYGAKGEYYYAFYPNPVNYNYLDKLSNIKKLKNEVIIQVGNSADPTNKHGGIFDKLIKFKDKNIKIICPLSYGNQEYAELVISDGRKIFGNKFEPLTEFLNADEYGKILSSVDVAIFNHDRQQAMGNTLALLYLGKKVYIKNTVTPWELFKEKNIKVFNTYDLDKESFESFVYINDEDKKNNKKIVKEEFSEEKCEYYWNKIFEE